MTLDQFNHDLNPNCSWRPACSLGIESCVAEGTLSSKSPNGSPRRCALSHCVLSLGRP